MAYYASTVFSFVTGLVIVLVMFYNIFNAKKKMMIVTLYSTLIMAVPCILFFAFDHVHLNMLTFALAVFFIALVCFDCSWVSALVIAIVAEAALTGSEFLAMNFLTIIFGTNLTDYRSTDYMYFLMTFISKLMFFLICQLISHFKLLFFDKSSKNSITPFFLLIYPLCTMFACGLLWRMSFEYNFSNTVSMYIVLACAFFLLSIIATYIFYNKSSKKEAELFRLQADLNRVKVDEDYYKVLDQQNQVLKTFVHDEKNHLAVIKSLADNEEIDKYIDNICSGLSRYSSSGNTNNKMLDLIINKYKLLCETENIDFDITIKTSNLSFMDNADLNAMLSNILDNAVEAAKKSKIKKIDLSINKANGFDMLTCVNSSDSKPHAVAGTLKTTKDDKRFHGIGVKSIKRIVGKYKGSYDWEYDSEKHEFFTYIIFNNSKIQTNK